MTNAANPCLFGWRFRLQHWRWLLRRPTIVFAIPLRSRATAADWEVECTNLRRTVRSCLAQRNARPLVVIAGHEMPEFLRSAEFSSVVFAGVAFPPPSDRSAYMTDKLKKKIFAAATSRELRADRCLFMYVDGDDVLHPDLAYNAERSLTEYDDAALGAGFVVDMKNNTVSLLASSPLFHRICGTCFISKISRRDLPLSSNAATFIGKLHDHTKFLDVSESHNRTHTTLDVPLVAYMVNHGNNVSGSSGHMDAIVRKNIATAEVRREMLTAFGLALPDARPDAEVVK